MSGLNSRPGRVVCPAPGALMRGFLWRGRRLAALGVAAGHRDPWPTPAGWESAQAIAWGNPVGPPWRSAQLSALLSVENNRVILTSPAAAGVGGRQSWLMLKSYQMAPISRRPPGQLHISTYTATNKEYLQVESVLFQITISIKCNQTVAQD